MLSCSQLYLLFSYISNCIVSSFKDYRTNEGLINGTAVCLVQPCLLAFSFIPCSMRLPTKPSDAGTDMRSPGGTVTGTSIQVVKSPRHQTDKNHRSRQGKNSMRILHQIFRAQESEISIKDDSGGSDTGHRSGKLGENLNFCLWSF